MKIIMSSFWEGGGVSLSMRRGGGAGRGSEHTEKNRGIGLGEKTKIRGEGHNSHKKQASSGYLLTKSRQFELCGAPHQYVAIMNS